MRQGIGITDEETDSLNAALAAEQGRLSRDAPRPADLPGNSPRQLLEQELQYASNSSQLVRVASRYLSTRQLEAYEQLLEQRTLTAQRLLRIMDGGTGE